MLLLLLQPPQLPPPAGVAFPATAHQTRAPACCLAGAASACRQNLSAVWQTGGVDNLLMCAGQPAALALKLPARRLLCSRRQRLRQVQLLPW